jgi:mono/diheme cytochrome c family protein
MEAVSLVLQEAGTLVKVGHWSAALFLAILVASSLGLSGCDSNSYSAAIRYLVRTDPLVTTNSLGPPDNPGGERHAPDRPGQLPIFSAKDLLDFPNPYFLNAGQEQENNLIKDGKMIDPTRMSAENRKTLQDALDELFGTPAHPKVDGISDKVREELGLTTEVLEKGSYYYRIQCLHCHGVTGNGRGPTSRWVNPHPRDYRRGLFKFQSVNQVDGLQKPSRADLMRTLEEGIEGTQMPSFALLGTHDLETMVSYVIHLSIRGEAEFTTIKRNFNPTTLELNPEADLAKDLQKVTKVLANSWASSQKPDMAIPVVAYPKYTDEQMRESVERGRALFLANEKDLEKLKVKGAASCVSCHADYGRKATFRFDEWGTLVRPADLTRGKYRGGSRPVDLYYRIHSGINGSLMAPFGSLSGEQIWDLVNFVRALPYKGMRDKFGINLN